MPIVQLLVSLLPTVFSLMHVAEASSPAQGTGAVKQQSVLDALRIIMQQFPALDAKVEPFLALVKPIMTVYVTLSNTFGWNPAVAQMAAMIASDTQPPAPVSDAHPTPVAQ